MALEFLSKGIIIGLAIAAPVGPIGILCIRRTLAKGRLSGFITGLGAATADFLYGSIAAFGLTSISNILINNSFWLKVIGGIFLIYLGIKTFLAKVDRNTQGKHIETNLLVDYSSTLLLTITNPTTIFSFLAVFAGFGVANTGGNYFLASLLTAGVLLGSAIWWLGLSSFTSLFKKRINVGVMEWINKMSGGVITVFGVVALLSLLNR